MAIDFSMFPEDDVQVWTQNGTSVTNGDITLTVGTKVTGYSVTATIDGEGETISDWYVLGAKDGKLLITTNTCPETVELSGEAGFTNTDGTGCPWVTTLNTVVAKYSDGDMAESARTIDYDDINRITGYNPEADGSNVGEVWEYGNEVTYTLKASSSEPSKNVLWYKGTKQPIPGEGEDQDGVETPWPGFSYWDYAENDWVSLKYGESITLRCTYAYYWANSVNGNVEALLFTDTGFWPYNPGTYWLGTPRITCGTSGVDYGLYVVYGTNIGEGTLYQSGEITDCHGIRPVVTLKSSVKVTSAGVLSK